MNQWNRTLFSLALGAVIATAAPSVWAMTVINGSLFDVSYDETQFFSGGGFGLSGNIVSYSPDFPLTAIGSMSINDFGKTFDIIPHAGITLQGVTMNVSGYYDNFYDSTTLEHTGALAVNGNSSNVYPFVFSSFTSGSWSTSAMVSAAASGSAAVTFGNGLSAFSSGFGDASVSIDNINFNVNVSAVPLPSALLLMLTGLLGLGISSRGKLRLRGRRTGGHQ